MYVELCFTKQSLLLLVRLICQSVFSLQSTIELVCAWGLQSETILSKLSKQLRGIIPHPINCHERIGPNCSHVNLLKRDYKPSWISKTPRQRITACNFTISAKVSDILNKIDKALLKRGAISKVSHMSGKYFSSYFVVPKFKRMPDK